MTPLEEIIEAFEGMPDETDEIIVTTSAPVPQDQLDDWLKAFMRHNPEGQEEFILTVTPLDNNRYKVVCPYVGK